MALYIRINILLIVYVLNLFSLVYYIYFKKFNFKVSQNNNNFLFWNMILNFMTNLTHKLVLLYSYIYKKYRIQLMFEYKDYKYDENL